MQIVGTAILETTISLYTTYNTAILNNAEYNNKYHCPDKSILPFPLKAYYNYIKKQYRNK